jgi:hypothetical protein
MNAARVVAIAELRASPEVAAPLLAPHLGATAYELRLALSAGLPAIVLMTPDERRADAARDRIASQGHRVVTCARSDVVPSRRMTALKDFRFDVETLVATATGTERLPFSDILVLLRASHRTTTETTTEVKERKLRPGMAIATGGLVMTKTTTREVTSRSEEREQVLYLFRKGSGVPWILRERSGRYKGLGGDVGRTTLENFAMTILRLRELSPGAIYDERLGTARAVRGIADGIDAADLLAHLVALDVLAR